MPGRNASRMGRTTVRMPNFIRAVSGADAPDPSPNPACCGHTVPEAGPFYGAASFSPVHGRPLTTRPSAGRVRPDWNSAVSGSGEPGACRHETGLTEPPESDEQLAGERYDHHTTDSSPASRGSVFEPFAKRVIWLMAQPAPRHLNELSPDPTPAGPSRLIPWSRCVSPLAQGVAIREVINGVMYILSTGCQWRALPKDLPPRSTVHDYLGLWNWGRHAGSHPSCALPQVPRESRARSQPHGLHHRQSECEKR